MQHPNQPIFKILAPTIEIQQFAPPVGRQPRRQGIDGEVTAMEILFDATALHRRERRGMLVKLGARCNKIKGVGQSITLRLSSLEQIPQAKST